MKKYTLIGLGLALMWAGCDGKALFQKYVSGDGEGPSVTQPRPAGEVTAGGMLRLTRDEYDNTLRDLLLDNSVAGFARLPEDVTDPFDNDFRTQQVSGALVETVETLAMEAAERAVKDPLVRALVVPCQPKAADDAACLRQFVTTFGRRIFRGPVPEADVQRYLALGALAKESNDFYYGVQLALQAMLQDPRFLYRAEVGTPVPGQPKVHKLGPYELATRLSYFLWGSTPPDWLLDQAEAGGLQTPEGMRDAALRLLADERAKQRVDRFHALWFGYHQLPHPPALTQAMREESGALVRKVVFEDRSDYFQLFTADKTWVTPLLAEHYGLPAPAGEAGWVKYGASGRRGILSHGSVLSQASRFSDTSPTQRGIWIRERMLCQHIPPPPSNANVDEPPPPVDGPNCKKNRYQAHANVGSCKSCHESLDGVGWGLEAYDRTGRFRAHDEGEPDCPIDGEGYVPGQGTFNGPAGLSQVLMESGYLETCVATQLFRFAHGRRETPGDSNTIGNWVDRWKEEGRVFDALLLSVVTDPTFGFRKEE